MLIIKFRIFIRLLINALGIMPVNLHFHDFPGCGTKHNSSCQTIKGTETNCFQATQGPHRGEWACFHVEGEGITKREFQNVISELFEKLNDAPSEQKRK